MNYETITNALEYPRAIGKTHAICEAALAVDATVLTHSRDEALRLEKEYGVRAMSIHSCAGMRGSGHAALIDNHAVYCIMWEMQREIEIWRKEAVISRGIIKELQKSPTLKDLM